MNNITCIAIDNTDTDQPLHCSRCITPSMLFPQPTPTVIFLIDPDHENPLISLDDHFRCADHILAD